MFKPARPEPFELNLQWRYVAVPIGTTIRGWVAGPVVGVWTHWRTFTKPCHRCLTDGKLPCSLGIKCVPRFVAYMPLIEEKRREQIVVMLSRTAALKYELIAHATPVECSRPNVRNNPPLVVRACTPDELSASGTKNVGKREPEDIRPYLLHLWQDKMLTEHLGGHFIPSQATTAEDVAEDVIPTNPKPKPKR
jgi:hypothetical protein